MLKISVFFLGEWLCVAVFAGV